MNPFEPQQKADIFGIAELQQMKNEFGIDVPSDQVPLPSGGQFYPAGHPWHNKSTVMIKAMTAAEEDILLNEAYAKSNTTLDKLIQACLVGSDRLSDKEMNSILLGDRIAMMLFVRIVGYGAGYRTSVKCPTCGKTSDVEFDLAAREISSCKHEPLSHGQNLFEYELPSMKKKVRFRLPIVSDEKEAAETAKAAKRLATKHGQSFGIEGKIVTNSLLVQIQGFEKSPGEWVVDPSVIRKFVNYIPATDSRHLRKFMKECEPGVDMGEIFECNSCHWEGRVEMPLGKEFFWPDT